MSGTSEPPTEAQPPAEPETPETEPMHEEYPFLVPGPTPESNEGCFRWGLAWTAFSLFLILIIAVITVGCFFLARIAG